jgi:hypothetical protein
MLKAPPRTPEWLSWLLVALWSLVIFASVPAARTIQRFVTERWGRQSFTVFSLTAVGLIIALTLLYLYRHLGRIRWQQALWLVGVAAVYFLIAGRLKAPEESLHFLEYGILGILGFRAASHRMRDGAIYLYVTLLCTLVGTVDEILQWVTPERFWEFRDVWLNAASAGLAQLAIWKGLAPAYISARWSAASVRRLYRLGISLLLLLTLCALNTPARVDRYTQRFPSLSFLRDNPSVMAEYGDRHRDPEIGVFFSRLSIEELAAEDEDRHQEAAAVFDAYRAGGGYGAFLVDYPGWREPFLHEARVHLFRRDRYHDRARGETGEKANGAGLDADLATVAWKEQRILEKYFAKTLAASSFVLSPAARAELGRAAVPDARYVSAVSQHLITRVSERGIVEAAAILALLGLIVLRRTGR